MNKVINGKRYDTETAKKIGEYANTYDYSNFNFVCEELYIKRTGEFFLYAEGGPMSEYAVYDGNNNWSSGCKIIPLSIEEAKEWAEKNLDADDYEKYFEIEEDGNIAFSLLIPENLYNKLKNESEKTKKTMKDIIIKSLEKNL